MGIQLVMPMAMTISENCPVSVPNAAPGFFFLAKRGEYQVDNPFTIVAMGARRNLFGCLRHSEL
ncbi:MAG: hypothetical protein AAFU69_11680, partial [Pseudomonadota bacterium]